MLFYLAEKFPTTRSDVALFYWLEEISKNEDWVLPESMVNFNGRLVSIQWLNDRAKGMEEMLDAVEEPRRGQMREMAQLFRETADAHVRKYGEAKDILGQEKFAAD